MPRNKRGCTKEYNFFKISQKDHESVADFTARLEKEACKCGFKPDELETRLLERFTAGLKIDKAVDFISSDSDITYKKAINTATIFENREQSRSIQSTSSAGVSKVDKACFRCGGKNHSANECFFAEKNCFKCEKKGHTSNQCKNKKFGQKKRKESRKRVQKLSINMVKEVSANPVETIKISIKNKEIEFEIDTGAAISIVPKNFHSNFFSEKPLLEANVHAKTVSGETMEIVGRLEIKINGKKGFLYVTNVYLKYPLLGRDLLDVFFPNWRKTCFNTIKSKVEIFSISENPKEYLENFQTKILKEYNGLFSRESVGCIKHIQFNIRLKPNVKPCFSKAYEVPLALKDNVELELKNWVSQGIIQPVKYSAWASPVVLVKKKSGGIRLCADFKKSVNPKILIDQYPLPTADEIFYKIGNGKYFAVLDLSNAYLQLKVDNESQEILTINTHMGLFRFNRVPFGLASAPAGFQAIMDQILHGLSNTAWYLDDIIVAGNSIVDLDIKLRKVLDRLKDFNVGINLEKSRFFETKVEFLGHIISENSIAPSQVKIKALRDAPTPRNVTEVRAFIGLANYYRKFIKNFTELAYPLYELEKKNVSFQWSKKCELAFNAVKEAICNSSAIINFDPKRETILITDASEYGIGGVLSQLINGEEKIVSCFSRTLSEVEKKLPQIQKEALAIVESVKKFHKFLFGHKFILVTDHQPLKSIFGCNKGLPKFTINRLQNYAVFLQSYNYDIRYKKGKFIGNADCLSRLPLNDEGIQIGLMDVEIYSLSGRLTFMNADDVAKETREDLVLKRVKNLISTKFPKKIDDELRPFFNRRMEIQEVNGCLFWVERLIIPKNLEEKVLNILHDQHIGVTRMKILARKEVWFPDIDKKIEEKVKTCGICQAYDNKAPKNLFVSNWPKTSKPFQRVHIDFFTKFGRDFVILVDAYTKYVDVKMIINKDCQTVIQYLRNFISIFGFPESLVSDNGPPFQSKDFSFFLEKNKIGHIFSPPYHPQSNGQVEGFVKWVKRSLLKELEEKFKSNDEFDIHWAIASYLFNQHNTPNVTSGKSPNELIFCFKPATALSILRRPDKVIEVDENAKKFKEGEVVWTQSLGKKMSKNWEQGRIIKQKSNRTFLVQVNDDKPKLTHIGNLKKYKGRDGLSAITNDGSLREHDYAN